MALRLLFHPPPSEPDWGDSSEREKLPDRAREFVRTQRQDAQDRRLISRVIPLRGNWFPLPER